MHILQIYKDYPPVLGGIEGHLRDLSEGLAARGHHISVLVTAPGPRTEIERPRPGLTIIRAARVARLASTPLSPAMPELARQLHPDLAHLHFPYPPGDLAWRAVPNRPPLVVTYHSDIVRQRALRRLYGPLMRQTLARAARIIATSPHYIASSAVLRRYVAKCAVVPLGVDAARLARADQRRVAGLRARYNNRPLLLFVGRLRYYKGLHVLLDALPHIQAELLLAGSGPEERALAAQAARHGVAGRVHFLGDVPDDDLPNLYHAADLFVLPSHLRAEAFGIAQAEALAAGLPSVCTELGTGTSYVNVNGQTGAVVPPGDPAVLAATVNRLLAQPELLRRYGEAGRARIAAHFTRERMLDRVEAVYREVIRAG
jgi:rhamnosyl/mannosyltransferase